MHEATPPSLVPRPRAARGRVFLLGAAALTAVALAGLWAVDLWVRTQASAYIFPALAEAPTRDAVIVLGASVHSSGKPSAIVEDRLLLALEAYRTGKARKLLVSGDRGTRGYDEVNSMYAWLVRAGVPPVDIFLDHEGYRTLDSMERAARVFHVRTALVSTQAFHLPRALFLARRAGIDAVGVPADRRTYLAALRDALRERLATALAVIDTLLLGRGPRVLGLPIPIDGDGRVTHDDRTPPEHLLRGPGAPPPPPVRPRPTDAPLPPDEVASPLSVATPRPPAPVLAPGAPAIAPLSATTPRLPAAVLGPGAPAIAGGPSPAVAPDILGTPPPAAAHTAAPPASRGATAAGEPSPPPASTAAAVP